MSQLLFSVKYTLKALGKYRGIISSGQPPTHSEASCTFTQCSQKYVRHKTYSLPCEAMTVYGTNTVIAPLILNPDPVRRRVVSFRARSLCFRPNDPRHALNRRLRNPPNSRIPVFITPLEHLYS